MNVLRPIGKQDSLLCNVAGKHAATLQSTYQPKHTHQRQTLHFITNQVRSNKCHWNHLNH